MRKHPGAFISLRFSIQQGEDPAGDDAGGQNRQNIHRCQHDPGNALEEEACAKAVQMAAEQDHLADIHHQRHPGGDE